VQCNGGRCDNGQACNGVGNICKEAPLPDGGVLSINASTNCCNGGTGSGLAVCKLDMSGIPRCFGGYSGSCPNGYTGEAGCCIAEGDVCQFREQCCNGLPCLPATDGGLRCTAPTCLGLGSSCGDGGACCTGTECIAGACRTPAPDAGTPPDAGAVDAGTLPDGGAVDAGTPDAGVLCTANGGMCSFSAECCSLICTGGVCQPPPFCQPQDADCTTSADCCSGLACVIPGGATSGTCQPNSCIGAGQTCAAGSASCCAGLSCLDSNLNTCGATGQCTCTVRIN